MEESEADGEGKDLELDDVAVGRGEGEEHESLDDVGAKFNNKYVAQYNKRLRINFRGNE